MNALPKLAAKPKLAARPKLAAVPAAPAVHGEHIVLESAEVPEVREAAPRRVRDHFSFDNRSRGTSTEFTLFDNGFLGVREQRRRGAGDELMLDLRHLDPRPALTRSFAKRTLGFGLGSIALGAAAGLLAYFSIVSTLVAVSAVCAMLAVSAVTFSLFVHRTWEEVTFRTKHAQTTVLTLRANFGCFRASRAVVPKLVSAINQAQTQNALDKKQQLRDETREHYRLRDAGALTDDACATGMRRILSQFD